MNSLQAEPRKVGEDQYQVQKGRYGGVGIELTLSLSPKEDIPTNLLREKLKEGDETINGTPVLWGRPDIIEKIPSTRSSKPEKETVVFFPILQISKERNTYSIKRVAFDNLERRIEKEASRYQKTLQRVGQRIKEEKINIIKQVNLVLEFKFRVSRKML